MFSCIVSGHNHEQRIGNNSVAYISLLQHIHKGMLIRRVIASHLCRAFGCQQFRKELRKLQMRTMFERYYSFFHYCL